MFFLVCECDRVTEKNGIVPIGFHLHLHKMSSRVIKLMEGSRQQKVVNCTERREN